MISIENSFSKKFKKNQIKLMWSFHFQKNIVLVISPVDLAAIILVLDQ